MRDIVREMRELPKNHEFFIVTKTEVFFYSNAATLF